MRPFTVHEGIAVPLPVDDINTDVIIPTHRAVHARRSELGRYAFEPLRTRRDGAPDPEFPLNQPKYAKASILVAGDNFGCGSSREMAVWALWEAGIRVVIAPGFGDIFYLNACKNGLLPVRLDAGDVALLVREIEAADRPLMSVDLLSQTVMSPSGRAIAFAMDEARRNALLRGLDDIGQTLQHLSGIEDWVAGDRLARPWVHRHFRS